MTQRIEVFKAVRVPLPAREIRAPIEAAAGVGLIAARLQFPNWALTLRITGDRELHRLNRRFLSEDHPTDVLSFPAGDGDPYLGDIVVSWPAAKRQGIQFGHDAATELALLSVHGLLHLLGFDHVGSRAENEMNGLTVMVLAKSGLRPAAGRLTPVGA